MANERNFLGVWIPREIWLDKLLSLQEKAFLVEIQSLDNDKGCWANNKYFADFFNLSTVRVSEVINSLVRKGYLSSEINQADGNRRILRTLLKVSLRPSQTKVSDPLKEKFIHNNTKNNTSNTFLSGRSAIERNQTPVNASLDLELNTWLGAVAVACGAKSIATLPKKSKWEGVCVSAIREQRDLARLLKIIEAEKQRLGDDTQFFSPETCFQKLQMNGGGVVKKFTH